LIDGLVSQRQALLDAVGDLGTDAADTFNKNIKSGLLNLADVAQNLKSPFVGSQVAGLAKGTNLSTLASYEMPNLFTARSLRNPFKEGTQPFQLFEKTKAEAVAYNISINVAPGASGVQIGRALVDAITEYERIAGKTWRKD